MSAPTASRLLLAALALALAPVVPCHAAAPKKQSASSYQRLWSQSPFTVKPPPPEVADAGPGPLEDFTLASVSNTEKGWFVVLMNKKKREERIRIVPGETSGEGFKILEVKQEPTSYKDTKVQLAYQGDTGWVGYEDKYLALKQSMPTRATTAKPGTPARPTNTRPAVPTPRATSTSKTPNPTPTTRAPRIRRVPTPPQR